MTEAARSNGFNFVDESGNLRKVSLINLARDVAMEIPAVILDIRSDQEVLLNSICQFDALSCLVAMQSAGANDGRYFYPNSAQFYAERTQPILDSLVADSPMRSALGLGDDFVLKGTLRAYIEAADRELIEFRMFSRNRSGVAIDWLRAHEA